MAESVLKAQCVRVYEKSDNISRLLTYAVEEGLPLCVRIEAYSLRFNSFFAAQTNVGERYLAMESLFPSYGNDLMKSNRFVMIEFVKGNFMISFSVPFEKGWKEENEWLWEVQFPQRIQMRRLRRHLRVEPSANEPISVYFTVNDDIVLGQVVDLSMGGALFASNVREPTVSPGKEIVGMELRLPGKPVHIDAVVTRVGRKNCAVAFTSLSEQVRAELRKYVELRISEIRRRLVV